MKNGRPISGNLVRGIICKADAILVVQIRFVSQLQTRKIGTEMCECEFGEFKTKEIDVRLVTRRIILDGLTVDSPYR